MMINIQKYLLSSTKNGIYVFFIEYFNIIAFAKENICRIDKNNNYPQRILNRLSIDLESIQESLSTNTKSPLKVTKRKTFCVLCHEAKVLNNFNNEDLISMSRRVLTFYLMTRLKNLFCTLLV